jgi:hypothetical protein
LAAFLIHRLSHLHTTFRTWQVLVSDASEPAEGEHKIVRLVRTLRRLPGYDPNTRHAIYGQVRAIYGLFCIASGLSFSSSKAQGLCFLFFRKDTMLGIYGQVGPSARPAPAYPGFTVTTGFPALAGLPPGQAQERGREQTWTMALALPPSLPRLSMRARTTRPPNTAS